MPSLHRYSLVLAVPQMRALVLSSLVARMPFGIQSLALVLFLRERTGSFAAAGGVTAAFALAGGVFSPLQGRIVDRVGQTRVLVPCVVVHAAALVGLVVLALGDAPPVVLALVAALAGAAIPPVWACLRPILMGLIGEEELLPAAYALDAILIEAVFILGPLLTALLVAVFSPAVAVLAGAGFAVVGTLWFAALPASRAWRGEERAGGIAGALASPGIRTLALGALPLGVCFGTLEVALPAFGVEHGGSNVAGILVAILSIGSMVGGVLYGAAAERLGSLQRGYLLMLAALPPCFVLLALPSSLWPMLALSAVAGCMIAPLTAAESQLTVLVAPRGSATEAVTWIVMATVVGLAAGNALAGVLVQASGWRAAVLCACALGAVGAGLTVARRRTLQAVPVAGGA